MNAPATAAAIAESTLEHIAIEKLRPSPTHIQALRRARFDKTALAELADSIRKVGLLQPLVAMPFKKSPILNSVPSDPTHIIVAGERRWLAAKEAGLRTVPVNVRELTDEEVLEVQLIENLQREGLHELEEAEGYDELMKLKKINADAVAGMVGKSRSYVYARTKLLALCPEARKAFYAGELDASKALLIARIGHHDTQRQAMKDLAGNQYDGPLSYREAHRLILEEYMLKLKGAPFALDDATLLPKAGTCKACPKRTGNQRDLFADVKDADICTDPKCFADKKAAHFERKCVAAEKAGQKVITGAAAKAIFPTEYRREPGGGYVGLDTTCWDDPKNRKVRELVAKHPEAVELVQHPKSQELVEAVRSSTLTEILNERGVKTHRQKVAASTAKSRKDNAKDKADEALREQIDQAQAVAIYQAAPAKLTKPMLLALFDKLTDSYEFQAMPAVGAMLGITPDQVERHGIIEKKLILLSETDLTRVLVAALIYDARDGYDQRKAKEALGWVKVDLKKVEAKTREEAKKIPGGEAGFKASKGLAAIVGPLPLAKAEILKRVEDYVAKQKLRDGKEIKLDTTLKAALGKSVARIGASELRYMVEAQVTLAVSATKYDKPAKKAKKKSKK